MRPSWQASRSFEPWGIPREGIGYALPATADSKQRNVRGNQQAAAHFVTGTIKLGLGKHPYSMTLVLGEEIELEIFWSTKTVEDLSKETLIEETFSQSGGGCFINNTRTTGNW